MSTYLSAEELADLVGCKPNQRTKMAEWLTKRRWCFEVDVKGLPKVARAHHDRKMGISEGTINSKYADEPNRQAFSQPTMRKEVAAQTKAGRERKQ